MVIDLGSCPEPVVETTNIIRVSWIRSDCKSPLSDNETGFCRTANEPRRSSYQRIISNVDIPTFKTEVLTTTCNFVGCILSATCLGGVQDREGSVVVVIVHRTEEFRRLSHAWRISLLPHFLQNPAPILRPLIFGWTRINSNLTTPVSSLRIVMHL